MARNEHINTSVFDRVNIDSEPNKVVHTSTATFGPVLKTFISIYPSASANTLIMARDASDLNLVLLSYFNNIIEDIIVIGKIKYISLVSPTTAAIDIEEKATLDKLEPI